MTWVATADFNGLTNGDLNGQGGGSGWSANWSGNTEFDVEGGTVFEGTKAVEDVTNASRTISRDLTSSTTSGVLYVALRKSTTSAVTWSFRLQATGTILFSIDMDGSSQLAIANGLFSNQVLVNPFSINTWYTIRVTFDSSNVTAAYSTAAFGAAANWSAESPAYGRNSGSVNRVLISRSTGVANCYIDYISDTSPFVETSVKTVDDLAKASVKTADGLAIASVKTFDGLA